MGKFSTYNIVLKSLEKDLQTIEFQLDNMFFKNIEGPEIPKGNIRMEVTIRKTAGHFDLGFLFEGTVYVPCDRCLDEVSIPVAGKNRLLVKMGETYREEDDQLVIIPEKEGEINLAWFLYEFVALSVPAKRVHPSGSCNKGMLGQLKKHITHTPDDVQESDFDSIEIESESDQEYTDPRWDALKSLKNEE